MPGWLQAFARNNPVTIWANTMRGFTLGEEFVRAIGESMGGLVLRSAVWIALILVVFVPLSIRMYRRT
jgi:hypothetical protein